MADEMLDQRFASIGIFNGMTDLIFFCDGPHYISWHEFLDKEMTFWRGSAA